MEKIIFYSPGYKNILNFFVVYPIVIISFLVSIYVYMKVPLVSGVENLFLLPLSFSICSLIFKNVYLYQKGGWALKVFYVVLILRYVVMPFATCWVGHMSDRIFSPAAYRYSIFIEIIELIASLFFINRFYIQKYKHIYKKFERCRTYYSDISIGGLFVVLAIVLLVLSRGIDQYLTYMRFAMVTSNLEDEIYGYDVWLAQTALGFLVIVTASIFQKRNDKKESILNFIPPLLCAMLSCMMAFGNNRAMILFFTLSALSVLMYAFPMYRRGAIITIIPAFAIMIVSFTFTKQFNIDVTTGDTKVANDDLALGLSRYVCTTEGIARVYDYYDDTERGGAMNMLTPVAGIVEKIPVLRLPATYPLVKKFIVEYPPTWRLAQEGSEICPLAGEAIFYGSPLLGWLIDILFMFVVIYVLIILEIRSKLEENLGMRYLTTWLSVTCGMIMCYNLGLVFYQFNFIPFFIYVLLFINDKVRIKKRSVRIA